MTSAITSASFGDRVRALLGDLPAVGVIDRFAANDLLLDLLDVVDSSGQEAAVLAALAALPKSSLVERSTLNALLASLCPSQN